jgi:hypothetical protein
MTDVQTTEPPVPGDPQTDTPTPEVKAPEPWTATKVLEWNAYYDIYVALGVLLLAFLSSANQLTTSATWTQLQAGRELSHKFDPSADPFSFSQPGQRWVHANWLSDLVHYQVYNLVSGFAPPDQSVTPVGTPDELRERASQGPREQWGIGGLVALDAVIRALTVLVLLGVRFRGPGLWWVASVVVAAMIGIPVATGISTGVFTSRYTVGSWPWGEFLFSLELLCLFRAFLQGKMRALYFLVPLFVLWANVDESFLFGLVVLAFAVAGLALPTKAKASTKAAAQVETAKAGLSRPAIVLGVCILACLLNPSTFRVFPAALGSVAPWIGWSAGPNTPGQLSMFSGTLEQISPEGYAQMRVIFIVLVAFGYASFLVNRRRFSRPLLLAYTGGVLFWALGLVRYQLEFASLLAVVLAVNGQQWYQNRFGTEGHLGRGWAFWSIGGRAVTICLVFLATLRVIFGVYRDPREPSFGFGFNPDTFAFEAAEAVRESPVQGNILNTWLPEGDALVWRAYPKRKSFVDSRRHLFSAATFEKDRALRDALLNGKAAAWKPILDEYKASVILIGRSDSSKTYKALLASPDWIRFYDDGRCSLFGRADAIETDLAYFRSHKLDADNLVYKNPTLTPSSDQLPPTTSILTGVYQSRARGRVQSHTVAGSNWLSPPEIEPDTPFIPDPAHCLMAIREARHALAQEPGDSSAYRLLATAYSLLLTQEAGLLGGYEPSSERIVSLRQFSPQVISLLQDRFLQLVTVVNFAIQTTPAPLDTEDRQELAALHLQLAELYAMMGVKDLYFEQLEKWMDMRGKSSFTAEQYNAQIAQLAQLSKMNEDIRNAVMNITLENPASQILERATVARQYGAFGLSIQELEEGLQSQINPALIKPRLLDLYCQVGDPVKALQLWTGGNYADPQLGDGVGTAALRQGRVFLLMGNYFSALTVWNRESIPAIRSDRSMGAIKGAQALLYGEPIVSESSYLRLPGEVSQQAEWEYRIGMASLEAGMPADEVAKHLTSSLELSPSNALRPVIAYYLKKLGKPVPPAPEKPKPPTAAPTRPDSFGPMLLAPQFDESFIWRSLLR